MRLGRLILVGIALIAAAGALFELAAEQMVRRRNPPPGRLVDVGSAVLHLWCRGPGRAPTIVFEAGGGDTSLAWRRVMARLGTGHRVCAYDRAGQGWSSASDRPRDPDTVADELRTLLRRGGEAAPYLLVAHSRGGHFARAFAMRHPTEIAGLVLVDASVDGLPGAPAPLPIEEQQLKLVSFARYLAPFGIVRALQAPLQPRDAPGLQAALQSRPQALSANWRELEAIRIGVRAGALPPGRLGHVPVVVVTSAGPLRGLDDLDAATRRDVDRYRRAFQDAQRNFLTLSSCSRRLVAARSGHAVAEDEPEVVVQAVESALVGCTPAAAGRRAR